MSDAQQLKDEKIDVEEKEDGTAVATFPVEKGDKRVGRDPDDDDDAADGEGDGTRNTRRGRARRARARETKQLREQRIDELEGIAVGQQRMLQSLFRNQQEGTLRTLEGEANSARTAHAEAQRRHAEAIEKGDGKAASEAITVMSNAERYYNQVSANHAKLVEQMKTVQSSGDDEGQQQQQQQPRGQAPAGAPRDRRAMAEAEKYKEEFLDKYPWIDLDDKTDPTTAAILAIDSRVARDGFKWDSEDYWTEIEERAKEAMPHLFNGSAQPMRRNERRENDDDDTNTDQRREQRPRRGGPPLGGAGNRDERPAQRQVVLNPDMVKALDEANIPLTGGDEAMQKRRNRILASWRDSAPARAN